MIIISADNKRYVDIGSEEMLLIVLYTAEVRLSEMMPHIASAIDFLNTKRCSYYRALDTARQFNLVRDAFSQIPPEKAVFDKKHPSLQIPWLKNISPVITSCGNLFLTASSW